MGLHISDPEIVELADEVARMAGESRTEAIRRALLERRQRLVADAARQGSRERVMRFLEQEVWPRALGSRPDRGEEDAILGYGSHGV